MFEINRITVHYSPQEDRMALDVADAQAQLRRLWLTRRLLDRLVSALVKQLEPAVAPQGEAMASKAPVKKAAQLYAQLQARLVKKPAPPVPPPPITSMSLVREVRLSRTAPGAWQLNFTCGQEEPAEMTLQTRQLRQWLEALHRSYRKAQWTTALWPDWIGRPSHR